MFFHLLLFQITACKNINFSNARVIQQHLQCSCIKFYWRQNVDVTYMYYDRYLHDSCKLWWSAVTVTCLHNPAAYSAIAPRYRHQPRSRYILCSTRENICLMSIQGWFFAHFIDAAFQIWKVTVLWLKFVKCITILQIIGFSTCIMEQGLGKWIRKCQLAEHILIPSFRLKLTQYATPRAYKWKEKSKC